MNFKQNRLLLNHALQPIKTSAVMSNESKGFQSLYYFCQLIMCMDSHDDMVVLQTQINYCFLCDVTIEVLVK